ncbi:hypothetical protein [Streptomyces sp. NPDC002746]
MWEDLKIATDAERQTWEWEPLQRVGPLPFGVNHEHVERALQNTARVHNHYAAFERQGVDVYYDDGGALRAVALNAVRGPQAFMNGTALTGRLPSELRLWLTRTADAGERLFMGTHDDPAFHDLGLVMRSQMCGDYVRSLPLFVAAEWAERLGHLASQVPEREWNTCR